jgi:phage/plasmid-like protein (TIGR03299 family)
MSHELTKTNGLIEFAYRPDHGMPWHGLGQPMQAAATVDEWRAAAGMGWKIQKAFVRYPVAHGVTPDAYRKLDDTVVLFRDDTKDALGVVSSRYQVVQPGEVLEFFRDIVKVGGLELSAAGTIYGGKRFWATARIGEASPLSVSDSIGGFILLSTSADGSLATEARRTSTRVVCRNTLAIAHGEGPAAVRITHRSKFDSDAIKRFMGLNEASWAAFRHQIVRLANVPVNTELAGETLVSVMADGPVTPEVQDKVRASAGFGKVMDLFAGAGKGARLDGVYGTGWGLLNALTEYVDHWSRSRSFENRFASSQWGPGAALKERALDAVLALAK